MNIAVIPARGGSKRIPKKNKRLFCGKPIIAWSIILARTSFCFDRVIVSTDDLEIAEIAKSYGADVPFLRPKELADDYTTTIDVIKHAINYLETEQNLSINNTCCLYATTPLLDANDIQKGWLALSQNQVDFVFSAVKFSHPIHRAFNITENQRVQMYFPTDPNQRTQDMVSLWHDAGQFYWGTRNAWMNNHDIFSKNSIAISIPSYRAVDIDTEEDWKLAELVFGSLKEPENNS